MVEIQVTAIENEVDNLIKYKKRFDDSSSVASGGLAFIVIGFLLWIIGPAIGNAFQAQSFGQMLGEMGPVVIIIGLVAALVGFPIKLTSQPKYETAVMKTRINAVDTPEETKTALFTYLSNRRYGKKEGRISCALELIVEVSGEECMDVITGILEDNSYDDSVRSSAIWTLNNEKWFEQERVIDLFIQYLKNDPSPRVKSSAAAVLGYQKNTKVLMPLRAALNDPDKQVRKSAKEALKKLKEAGIR